MSLNPIRRTPTCIEQLNFMRRYREYDSQPPLEQFKSLDQPQLCRSLHLPGACSYDEITMLSMQQSQCASSLPKSLCGSDHVLVLLGKTGVE